MKTKQTVLAPRKEMSTWQVLWRGLSLVWETATSEVQLLTILNILSGSAPALIVWLSAEVIDAVDNSSLTVTGQSFGQILIAHQFVLLAAIALLVLTLFNDALLTIEGLVMDSMRDRVRGRTKRKLIDKLSKYPSLDLFEDSAAHDTIKLAERGTENIPRIADAVSYLIVGTFGMVPTLLLAGKLGWWIPIVLLVSAIPMVLVQGKVENESWSIELTHAPTMKRISILERVLAMDLNYAKEIRLLKLQSLLLERWDRLFDKMFLDMRRSRLLNAGRMLGWSFVSGIGTAFPYLVVIVLALRGDVSLGDLALYSGIIFQVRRSLNTLIFNGGSIFGATISAKPIFEILDMPPPAQPKPVLMRVEEIDGINFFDVSFTYPQATQQALSHVTLHLRKGERVAIVGENGAGKTTLVKLLCRFYEPQEGAILWDGDNISQMPIDDLREKITAVFQDYARFPFTMQENIGFGYLPDWENVESLDVVACKVGIQALIERLDSHWKTPLSKELEGGANLSGGQWQRVAIARAWTRCAHTDLVILDEPTSALDPNTEHEVLELFEQMSYDKISIIISHRLSLTRNADKIIVLDQGRIVETGTHAELMHNRGKYHQMFSRQASRYIDTHEEVAGD